MPLKTILVANRGYALTSSRIPLIKALQQTYHIVVVTADDEKARSLISEGVELETICFRPSGFHLLGEIATVIKLIRTYRYHQPKFIHHFHAKPVILGSITARIALGRKVKVINTITGLGRAFDRPGVKRLMASLGYKVALALTDKTIFQNPDDRQLFIEKGWVKKNKTELILSSGVDVKKFRPSTQQGEKPHLKVLMACRLLWQKGIQEYIDATYQLHKLYPDVEFLIAGELADGDPDAVTESFLKSLDTNKIRYIGYINNLQELLPEINIFVLPSYYREGVPRVVLEAAACGVPAIVADSPGTRESVQNKQTGLWVNAKDSKHLAEQMSILLSDHALRNKYGLAARQRCEKQFDIQQLTHDQLLVYENLKY